MAGAGSGVVITGIGLRTSVGNQAIQTSASVRAGMNRFAEWPHFAQDDGDNEPGPDDDSEEPGGGMIAAAVDPLLPNAPWFEKITDLLEMPSREALWQAQLLDHPDWLAGNGRFRLAGWLCVPYADRTLWDDEARKGFLEEEVPGCFGPGKPSALEIIEADNAGGMMALAQAVQALQENKADACMICGVDSFLHDDTLENLQESRRLKGPTQSAGLIPGEAGSVVILEKEASAQRRGVTVLARIASIALDKETTPLGSTQPSQGVGLTRALRNAVIAGGGPSLYHRVMVDLNGERCRFLEWALVETRCFGPFPRGWQLWHPADCLGEIGAAFGPAALALSARALSRQEAGPGGVLICASSLKGERGAVCLMPATP